MFGGADNFVTPKSGSKKGVNVKDAWNYITQSSFGYQSLKSMFKSGKDGKLLIDKKYAYVMLIL